MGHEFDFEFSDKLGKTAFELLFYFIEANLSKGVSLVAEAHFNPERNNERLNNLKQKYNINLLQIHCDCEIEALKKRFKERMKKDTYHEGHRHTISQYGEDRIMRSLGAENRIRLTIDGATYDLDTTNPEAIDYELLFGFISDNIK